MSEMIRLDKIGFCYKRTGFCISEISLNFSRGESTVMLGHNGSGKTTLSKLMIGIYKAQQGEVLINGANIKKGTLAQTAKSVGYLFQNPERQLFCNTVIDEVMFSLQQTEISEERIKEHALELLQRFSLSQKKDTHPLLLSSGQKQRLALLTVLALQPQYYILDEPFSGMDIDDKHMIVQLLGQLKESGCGICIITHDKSTVESLANRYILMEKGRVISDEKA